MIYRQNFFRIKIFKRIEFVSKSRKDGRRMKFNLHIGAPILAGERFNSPSHSFSATATTKDSPGDWFRWRCTHVSDFRRGGLSSLWLAFWKIQAQWTQWNKFSENATEFVWMSKAFYWHLKASEENECDFLKAEKCEMCARWMAAKRPWALHTTSHVMDVKRSTPCLTSIVVNSTGFKLKRLFSLP